jgi:hypothetical protein
VQRIRPLFLASSMLEHRSASAALVAPLPDTPLQPLLMARWSKTFASE